MRDAKGHRDAVHRAIAIICEATDEPLPNDPCDVLVGEAMKLSVMAGIMGQSLFSA